MTIVLYELVACCRDRNHQPFGNAGEKLAALELRREDGTIHESIRNIVLSAASGEGLDLTLGSPLA